MFNDPILQLFLLCTHLGQTPPLSRQVVEAAARIASWDGVAARAEKHGMAPLLYYHLKKAGVEIPLNIRRELAGLALRHRLINQVRTCVLGELITSFQKADRPLLILKGAALAHLLYPDSGLRPMKDMDILVSRSDLDQVMDLFEKAGFTHANAPRNLQKKRHLPDFTRQLGGFNITVEAHYGLFMDPWSRPWGEMKDLLRPPLPFSLMEGVSAVTLSHEEMLFHLCRHAFFDNHSLEPLCLIWVADICNYGEKFADEIDWSFMASQYPLVQHTLSALHEMTPLSDHLITTAQLSARQHPEKAIKTYQGWPGAPLAERKNVGISRWLSETLFPSAWWLVLRYGSSPPASLWYYWARHLFNLFGETLRRTMKRIKHTV
jgi:hypothetical protein